MNKSRCNISIHKMPTLKKMQCNLKLFLFVMGMLIVTCAKSQSLFQSTWEVPVNFVDTNTHVFFIVTNSSDTIISFLRPDVEKMNCIMKSPDNSKSQVLIKNDNRKAMWDDTLYLVPHKIYLQSGCTIKIDLGRLTFNVNKASNNKIEEKNILLLNYKSDIKEGFSKIQLEQILNSSDLIVSINADKNVLNAGTPVFVNVILKNSGNEVLEMKNEFFPYKESRFHFIIKYRKDSNAEEITLSSGNPYPALSDNNALAGQFILLPNEYLSVMLDVTTYIKEKGIYEIWLTYSDRVKVGKKKNPEYLEKFKWETNKIILNII